MKIRQLKYHRCAAVILLSTLLWWTFNPASAQNPKHILDNYKVVEKYVIEVDSGVQSSDTTLAMIYYFDKNNPDKLVASIAPSMFIYYDKDIEDIRELETHFMQTLTAENLETYYRYTVQEDSFNSSMTQYIYEHSRWEFLDSFYTKTTYLDDGSKTKENFDLNGYYSTVYYQHDTIQLKIGMYVNHLADLSFEYGNTEQIGIAKNGDTMYIQRMRFSETGSLAEMEYKLQSEEKRTSRYSWLMFDKLASVETFQKRYISKTDYEYNENGQLIKSNFYTVYAWDIPTELHSSQQAQLKLIILYKHYD